MQLQLIQIIITIIFLLIGVTKMAVQQIKQTEGVHKNNKLDSHNLILNNLRNVIIIIIMKNLRKT